MKNLTLLSIFKLAVRHIFIICLAAIVCGVAAFSYCNFVATPRYSATGSIMVTNGAEGITPSGGTVTSGTIDSTDVSSSLSIIQTVVDVLRNNEIYKELATATDNKYSYSALSSMAHINRREDRSLFIDISFTATSPEEAKSLVNAYLSLTPNYLSKCLPGCRTNVYVTESAGKVYPNTNSFTLLSTAAGALGCFAIIILIHAGSSVIRNDDDFSSHFDVPVIGNIPDFAKAKQGRYYNYYQKGYYCRGGNENEN